MRIKYDKVIELVKKNYTDEEIAAELKVSLRRIKKVIQSIRKAGCMSDVGFDDIYRGFDLEPYDTVRCKDGYRWTVTKVFEHFFEIRQSDGYGYLVRMVPKLDYVCEKQYKKVQQSSPVTIRYMSAEELEELRRELNDSNK